jgi:hypothetical protein
MISLEKKRPLNNLIDVRSTMKYGNYTILTENKCLQ